MPISGSTRCDDDDNATVKDATAGIACSKLLALRRRECEPEISTDTDLADCIQGEVLLLGRMIMQGKKILHATTTPPPREVLRGLLGV